LRSKTQEDEVSVVVDGMFPMKALVTLSRGFQQAFPEVTLKLRTENLGAVIEAVSDGSARIGVSSPMLERAPGLKRRSIGEVRLLCVCASSHALASIPGAIPVDALQKEVQIVLSDRSSLTRGVERAVLSQRTLSVADLGTKLELISAGLGWGNLPEHMVSPLIAQKSLVSIRPEPWGPHEHTLSLTQVVRSDFVAGAASGWLLKELERVCAG
jgi:DNA-binding transcriptional LysR family regulator